MRGQKIPRPLCLLPLSRQAPPLQALPPLPSLSSSPPSPPPLTASTPSIRLIKSVLASSSCHRSLNLIIHSKNCLQILPLSQHRMSSTVAALPHSRIKDACACMSATLEYQYNCWSELSYSNETKMVDQTMSYLDTLMSLSSNALSMIIAYDVCEQTGVVKKRKGVEAFSINV